MDRFREAKADYMHETSQYETRQHAPSTSRTTTSYVDSDLLMKCATSHAIIPRLKRDDIGVNVMPTVHAKAVTTTPVSDFY